MKKKKPVYMKHYMAFSNRILLELSRKDANHLLHVIKYCTNWYCGCTVEEDFASGKREKLKLKTTLLNKLKKQGIR